MLARRAGARSGRRKPWLIIDNVMETAATGQTNIQKIYKIQGFR
jgi:hypothetical protein